MLGTQTFLCCIGILRRIIGCRWSQIKSSKDKQQNFALLLRNLAIVERTIPSYLTGFLGRPLGLVLVKLLLCFVELVRLLVLCCLFPPWLICCFSTHVIVAKCAQISFALFTELKLIRCYYVFDVLVAFVELSLIKTVA